MVLYYSDLYSNSKTLSDSIHMQTYIQREKETEAEKKNTIIEVRKEI